MSDDITTGDILDYIKKQLDWRSSDGKPQGNIVISNVQATWLHKRVLELIRIQDANGAEIERLRVERDELGLRAASGDGREEEMRKDIERLRKEIEMVSK